MIKKIITAILTLSFIFSSISFSLALSENNLTYDANGNLIQGFDKYYEYNGFNQLETVRENSSSGELIAKYFYDPEGNRIKKIKHNTDGSNTTTYYIGANFVQIINLSGVYNETYYHDEDDLIARKDSSGTHYYHPDHLGSTTLVTNESGEEVEETSYLPYGGIITGGDSRYLFTGKEKDTETGLYYYGARYYNSYFSHFIQPDTNIKEIYNPQDLNRYAYTRNNPYKYSDPSGNNPILISGAIGTAVGASIGALISIGSQLSDTGQVNWGDVGKSAVIGGVSLGVAVTTMGLGTTALGISSSTGTMTNLVLSGVSGAISGQLTTNALYGNPLTGNIMKASVIGGALSIGFADDIQGVVIETLISNNLQDTKSDITNSYSDAKATSKQTQFPATSGSLSFQGYWSGDTSYGQSISQSYAILSAGNHGIKDTNSPANDNSESSTNNDNSDDKGSEK